MLTTWQPAGTPHRLSPRYEPTESLAVARRAVAIARGQLRVTPASGGQSRRGGAGGGARGCSRRRTESGGQGLDYEEVGCPDDVGMAGQEGTSVLAGRLS